MIKITDYGLMRVMESNRQMLATMCGTPLHMAPEILNVEKHEEGVSYNNKIDIYSLGIMFYQMVTGGRHPYDHVKSFAELLDHVQLPITRPRALLGSNISSSSSPDQITDKAAFDEMWDLINRMLSYDAYMRPSAEHAMHSLLFTRWGPQEARTPPSSLNSKQDNNENASTNISRIPSSSQISQPSRRPASVSLPSDSQYACSSSSSVSSRPASVSLSSLSSPSTSVPAKSDPSTPPKITHANGNMNMSRKGKGDADVFRNVSASACSSSPEPCQCQASLSKETSSPSSSSSTSLASCPRSNTFSPSLLSCHSSSSLPPCNSFSSHSHSSSHSSSSISLPSTVVEDASSIPTSSSSSLAGPTSPPSPPPASSSSHHHREPRTHKSVSSHSLPFSSPFASSPLLYSYSFVKPASAGVTSDW